MPISLSASSRSLRPSVSIVFFPYVPYTYTDALEKLSLQSLRKRRHHLHALFFFPPRCIVDLNLALPFWKMLAFVFLPTILGTSHCLVFVPLTNTILLLGVMISTYLQSETFLSNTLCSSCYFSSSSFVCLFVYFSELMFFSSSICL
jgi:hypothetical protein